MKWRSLGRYGTHLYLVLPRFYIQKMMALFAFGCEPLRVTIVLRGTAATRYDVTDLVQWFRDRIKVIVTVQHKIYTSPLEKPGHPIAESGG